MTDDDGLEAHQDDVGAWHWRWVGPRAVEVLGPGRHPSQAQALRAGKRWLREHRMTTR